MSSTFRSPPGSGGSGVMSIPSISGSGGIRSPPSSSGAGSFMRQQQQEEQKEDMKNNTVIKKRNNNNNNSSNISVSYEKFAPRASVQASRLSKIGVFTAGPTDTILNSNSSNSSNKKQFSGSGGALGTEAEERNDFLLRAMLVGNSSSNDGGGSVMNGTGAMDDSSNHLLSLNRRNTEDILKALSSYLDFNRNSTSSNSITESISSKRCVDVNVASTLEDVIVKSGYYSNIYKHITTLRLALRASMNIGEDISNRHLDLIRHSSELSMAADRLQEEERVLTKHAEEIGLPLKHYDTVDQSGIKVGVLFKGQVTAANKRNINNAQPAVTTVRGLAKVKVDDDDYIQVLQQIDQAVTFFSREAAQAQQQQQQLLSAQQQLHLISGSIEYYRRALILQEAALDLIREAVVDRIQNTSTQIMSALKTSSSSSSYKNDVVTSNNTNSTTASAGNTLTRKLKRKTTALTINADKLEASLMYTRFHGISQRSNRLIGILTKKLYHHQKMGLAMSSNKDVAYYYDLLQLCRTTYCKSRETLLRATVEGHMEKLKSQHGLVGMTRLACVFLVRLCTIETSLYLDFFDTTSTTATMTTTRITTDTATGGSSNTITTTNDTTSSSNNSKKNINIAIEDNEYQQYLFNLCTSMHKTIRRGLVSLTDIDILCQIIIILREELSITSHSSTTIPAATVISSIIQDTQERLIFVTNTTLTKQLIRYKPTPSDLDYPNKLYQLLPLKNSENDNTTNKNDASNSTTTNTTTETAVSDVEKLYQSWFPPVRTVLKVLSKLFRVVDTYVFEDIALQCVQQCTKCLTVASKYIQNKDKQNYGKIHSDLFLIKHLLILREQLSPFDMNLRSIERQLDFSDAGKAIGRFLLNTTSRARPSSSSSSAMKNTMSSSGGSSSNSSNPRNFSLFSMNTNENALFILLREGISVQESSIDSKRDLEDALRSSCNSFIDHTYTFIIDENIMNIVDLIQTVHNNTMTTTTMGNNNDDNNNNNANNNNENKKLHEEIKTSILTNILTEENDSDNNRETTKTEKVFEEQFSYVTEQMALYLNNPATQGILLKPTSRKILRTLDEIKKYVVSLEREEEENNWKTQLLTVLQSLEQKIKKFKPTSSTETNY